MAKAVALQLVVADFADELGPNRVPVELLALRPPTLPARDPLVAQEPRRPQLRQLGLDLLPHRRRHRRAMPHEVELPVAAPQAEEQCRDPTLLLLAVPVADDHAVG